MPDFALTTLDGRPVSLADYRGQVLLIVNVASQCGYTPQYAGLQALHEKYVAQGLAVLGFPSNDFGAQEPGTHAEIAEFCQANFGVAFEMFAKGPVRGDDRTPLFAWLTAAEDRPDLAGAVRWNFEKFLVGRDGRLAGRFRSAVEPESPELVAAIETALAQPSP